MDYDSFARYIRKLAPYTELHDLRIGSRDDNYGQIFEYTHKEYVTAWCLQKRDEGYKYIEVVDDARALGWKNDKPKIDFIFSPQEPYVIGIDARSDRMKEKTST